MTRMYCYYSKRTTEDGICVIFHPAWTGLASHSLGFQRELKRKLQVSKQSLQKVETACYAIQVRGSEIPKELLAARAVLAADDHHSATSWNEDFD